MSNWGTIYLLRDSSFNSKSPKHCTIYYIWHPRTRSSAFFAQLAL